jgi:hypothetical protein
MSLLGVFTVKFHDNFDNTGFCDKDFSFEVRMARNIVSRWNELQGAAKGKVHQTACTAHKKTEE